jgi:hypothetical protein
MEMLAEGLTKKAECSPEPPEYAKHRCLRRGGDLERYSYGASFVGHAGTNSEQQMKSQQDSAAMVEPIPLPEGQAAPERE